MYAIRQKRGVAGSRNARVAFTVAILRTNMQRVVAIKVVELMLEVHDDEQGNSIRAYKWVHICMFINTYVCTVPVYRWLCKK